MGRHANALGTNIRFLHDPIPRNTGSSLPLGQTIGPSASVFSTSSVSPRSQRGLLQPLLEFPVSELRIFFSCKTDDQLLTYGPIPKVKPLPRGNPDYFPSPRILVLALLWYCSLKPLFHRVEGFASFAVHGPLSLVIDLHETPALQGSPITTYI